MLYFGVIFCIRKCFIIVFIYTIRGTDIQYHTFYIYYMFRPDMAIFRYIKFQTHLYLVQILSFQKPYKQRTPNV
jgi:hypothetical protein